MAEHNEKRPAHEVILRHVEDCLQNVPDPRVGPRYAVHYGRFEILCRVLTEMKLPEKPREETIIVVRRITGRRRDRYSRMARMAISPKDSARRLIKEEESSDPFLDTLRILLHELRAEQA